MTGQAQNLDPFNLLMCLYFRNLQTTIPNIHKLVFISNFYLFRVCHCIIELSKEHVMNPITLLPVYVVAFFKILEDKIYCHCYDLNRLMPVTGS